jgi:CRISPR-associated endonuclease/helicase Cas3
MKIFYSRPSELLDNHTKEVNDQYNRLIKDFDIFKLIKESIEDNINENIILEILNNVPIYHDYGKMNPYFQEYILTGKYKDNPIKNHSEISCIKYINDMCEKYVYNIKLQNKRKEIKYKRLIAKYILNCSYNILKHHGNLNNIPEDGQYIQDKIDYYINNKKLFEHVDINIDNLKYIKTLNTNSVEFKNPFACYLLLKLNFALLIQADYLAVYKFNQNKDLEYNSTSLIINKIYTNFNNNEVIKNIYKYQNNEIELSEINTYRAKMFLESAKNLIENIDKNIFYLEAPTGSGKSTIAINLALNLINDEYNRIIYVSPLNNISEQMYAGTKEKLSPINEESIALINNRETIITTDEYSKDYLNYQTFNYPIIMTSHVKFFNILFGCNRKDLLALNSFKNSVIILDEVQNYKNKLWIKFINSISQISQLYNIKFVIMSATLPKMDNLLQEENKIYTNNLINDTSYYFDFFKKRVLYDYSMLDKLNGEEKNTIEEVLEKVDEVINAQNKHRILIETLSVKSCEAFYSYLKKYEKQGFKVYKMLSITNLNTRLSIIKEIQAKNKDGSYSNDKIILIGTQCIEAGIDIDMNIGFKDISILDYDEQFIGRIERNFYQTGICYFFDLDNEDFIYKDDYRIEFNLKNSAEYRKLFENKQFNTYYNNNYKWLEEKEVDDYERFKEDLNNLQYSDIEKSMQLINNDTYSFLFLGNYSDGENTYNSQEILDKYIELKHNYNVDYSYKQIKLKEIKKELSNFIYSINAYNFKEGVQVEQQEGFYIVEDGYRFFDNTYDAKLTDKSNLNFEMFKQSINLFI